MKKTSRKTLSALNTWSTKSMRILGLGKSFLGPFGEYNDSFSN